MDPTRRNHTLIWHDATTRVENGVAAAASDRCNIPRKRTNELTQSRDGSAAQDIAQWLSIPIVGASAGIALLGSFCSLPFLLVCRIFSGSVFDSRQQECDAGLRRRWLDDAVRRIADFLIMYKLAPARAYRSSLHGEVSSPAA